MSKERLVTVRATFDDPTKGKGFAGSRIRRHGDVFNIEESKVGSWMEVQAKKPGPKPKLETAE